MYVKIDRKDFKNSEIKDIFNSNDYDYFKKDGVEVFIYGYPYVSFESDVYWMTAEKFHKRYIEYPELIRELEGVSGLEGVFTIIVLDKIRDNCYIVTDRWGIYTCFYHNFGDYVLISDKIETIIQSMNGFEINKKSIVEMLTLGFRLGNETHIKDILTFEAGTIYDICIYQGLFYKYASLNGIKPELDKYRILKSYRNHISSLLRLEENPILTLTGGIDTRTILSSILHECVKPHCITFGVKDSKDVKISKKISEEFNLTHSVYILDKQFINNIPILIENNIGIFNGLIPTMHYLQFEKLCWNGRNKLLILGILGDEIWRQSNITVQKKFLDIFKEKYDFSFPKENKQILMSNWAGNLIKYLGKNFKIGLGLFWNDLIYNFDNLKDVQKYIIEFNNEELAKIPYDSGNKYIGKMKKFINDVLIKLFNKKLFFDNNPHYYQKWLRKYHKDYVLKALNWNNMFLKDLFERKTLNRIVGLYLNGDDSYFTFIISLLSIEIWFKNMKKIVRVD